MNPYESDLTRLEIAALILTRELDTRCGWIISYGTATSIAERVLNESPARFGVARYSMLDLWMALGGDSSAFEQWIEDPKRTSADAWSQLLGAVRGDVIGLSVDTNPPAGDELLLLAAEREGLFGDAERAWRRVRQLETALAALVDAIDENWLDGRNHIGPIHPTLLAARRASLSEV